MQRTVSREEFANSSVENEISPRRAEMKLRKNEMKLRKNEMKLRKNEIKVRKSFFVPHWKSKSPTEGFPIFSVDATNSLL